MLQTIGTLTASKPSSAGRLTVAIPTLDRGHVILDTIAYLQNETSISEIIVVDQTPQHASDVEERIAELDSDDRIVWLRVEEASIPKAMNLALARASTDIVLFLDDDIVPSSGIAAAHLANYTDPKIWAVVGQVIQPWQKAEPTSYRKRGGLWADLNFPFNSTERTDVANCMAGNLSLRRQRAIACGGFDEGFIGAAFRFETEFCRRLIRHGGKVVFDPKPSIDHLKSPRGGIRNFGEKMGGGSLEHHVGDYYFAFLEGQKYESIRYIFERILRLTRTRYFLLRPWKIPGNIVIHIKSMMMARSIYLEKSRDA